MQSLLDGWLLPQAGAMRDWSLGSGDRGHWLGVGSREDIQLELDTQLLSNLAELYWLEGELVKF